MVRRGPHVMLLIDVHWQANKKFVSSCVFFSSHYYPARARSAQAPAAWLIQCKASVSVKRHICRYTFVFYEEQNTLTKHQSKFEWYFVLFLYICNRHVL